MTEPIAYARKQPDREGGIITTLSRRKKLAYGAGELSFSLTATILGAYFAIFLIEVVGLRPAVAALVLLAGQTWDWINDPIVGYLSDRTRTRWGRRRPYLLFSALPLALTFAMLWWRPPLENLALVAYYVLAFILFETAVTLAGMPYLALTPELTDDYDERTSLTSYRMLFSLGGSLVAFTVPIMVVGAFVPENAPGALTMGALFGAAAAAPLLIVFFGIRERPGLAPEESAGARRTIAEALRNRPYLMALGMFLAAGLSISIVQATLLFYIRHVVGREAQADIIMAAVFVTAILSLPLWTWLAKRWSKRLAYVFGIAFWAVVQLALVTLSPEAGMGTILVLCVLAGIGVSAAHVLPWAILPDTIEWGEWLTGERHEGVYFSLVTLTQKAAAAIAIALALLVLDVSGYVAQAAVQSPGAIFGIRLVIGPVPALLLLLGILLALRYPLGRERYARVVAELRARREARMGEIP